MVLQARTVSMAEMVQMVAMEQQVVVLNVHVILVQTMEELVEMAVAQELEVLMLHQLVVQRQLVQLVAA